MRLERHSPPGTPRPEGAAACTVCGRRAGGRATLAFYGQAVFSGLPLCPDCYGRLRDREWVEGERSNQRE